MIRSLLLLLLIAPLSVSASENHCLDKGAAEEWNQIVLAHPNDTELKDLADLRKWLCAKVIGGDLPLDTATRQFERARKRLIQKRRKQPLRLPNPKNAA